MLGEFIYWFVLIAIIIVVGIGYFHGWKRMPQGPKEKWFFWIGLTLYVLFLILLIGSYSVDFIEFNSRRNDPTILPGTVDYDAFKSNPYWRPQPDALAAFLIFAAPISWPWLALVFIGSYLGFLRKNLKQ